MNAFILILSFFIFTSLGISQDVNTTIDSTSVEGEIILIQEIEINSTQEKAWDALTTPEGWESWAVVKAEIDLKEGGTIKTLYTEGEIGDKGTITPHILDLKENEFIKLQAEMTKNFPAFMKEDEKNLYSINKIEKLSDYKVKIIIEGHGYRNNEKYKSLMNFFISANERTLLKLKDYLENQSY